MVALSSCAAPGFLECRRSHSSRSLPAPRVAPMLSLCAEARTSSTSVFAEISERSDAATDDLSRTVVVTRERGKNGKLMNALKSHGIASLELPLIEHREGPDLQRLPSYIQDPSFDWFTITSPEAAAVFIEAWKRAGLASVRLAVVGSGTAQTFEVADDRSSRLRVEFIPSKANAKVLAEELPERALGGGRVLYPASLKASDELEKGLSARGFEVIRLNTYSTESVKLVDPSTLAAAALAPVVALASPTAVRAWVNLIDKSTWNGAAACIGQTSAIAAQNAGLSRVFYPESPGIDGWLQSILEALEAQNCMRTIS